jgi:hypothetical protein
MDPKRVDMVTGIVERTLLLRGAFAFHREATRIAAQIERSRKLIAESQELLAQLDQPVPFAASGAENTSIPKVGARD